MANENETREVVVNETPRSHTAAFVVLGVGLAAALGGDAYFISRSNHLSQEIAQTRDASNTQISKLNEATTTLLQQEKQRLEEVATQLKGYNDSATQAIRKARAEAQKHRDEFNKAVQDQQQQIAAQLNQIGEIKDTTTSKFTEVESNVDGVKQNVETVKADVASTRSDLKKAGADLKRVMGDMGVMSGLIATNSKDLDALRTMGERNYFEFDVTKKQGAYKIGNITIALKKADPKRNRFTVDVLADDKHVEKKDRTVNEPVQLYVSGNVQPYEIVVNEVKKDQIVGYLATPKTKLARR